MALLTNQEFRIIRPVDDIYTTPVRFSCYHLSVGIRTTLDNCQVDDCALCSNIRSSPAHNFLGGESHSAKSHIIIMHSDDHPYYGPNTILRIKCTKNSIHCPECSCSNPCANPRKPCTLAYCSQYYYTTISDLRDSVVPGGISFGIADCRVMHQIAKYPIYKCLVALEVITGLRWDFPIPYRGGCRVAYNPTANTAIVCSYNDTYGIYDTDTQIAQIRTVLPNVNIVVIPGATVDNIWPGSGQSLNISRAQMVDMCTYPNLVELARYLAKQIKFAGQSRLEHKPFRDALQQSMRRGRILVDEKQSIYPTVVGLNIDSRLCHYIDVKFMKSGVSGYAPEYDECIPNLRKQKEIKEKRYERLHQVIESSSRT